MDILSLDMDGHDIPINRWIDWWKNRWIDKELQAVQSRVLPFRNNETQ